MDETLVKKKEKYECELVDQQVHTNSIKSIERLLDAAGFHTFTVIHGQRCASREREKKNKDPSNRAVKTAKASGRQPISRAILSGSIIINNK